MYNILTERESLAELRSRIGGPLVQLSVNMPGPQKSNPLCFTLWRQGLELFVKHTVLSGFPILTRTTHSGALGHIGFFRVDGSPILLKRICLNLEDTELIGQYWDFDVFDSHLCKISRAMLGEESRKCFICDEPAKVCAFLRRHNVEELLVRMESDLHRYLENINRT